MSGAPVCGCLCGCVGWHSEDPPPSSDTSTPGNPPGVVASENAGVNGRSVSSNDADGVKHSHPASTVESAPEPLVLDFGAARGMGDWRVLVSNRASSDLRAHWRRDKTTFKRIGQKIQEISRGNFSGDNQKQLNTSRTNIPVFQAKIQGDLRLIYHVDCVQGEDPEFETQVIRLFGVYHLNEMDDRLWNAVASYYSGKSKLYRDRCIYRQACNAKGFVLPMTFPRLLEQTEDPISAINSLIDHEQLSNLHDYIILEKFSTLSQSMWNSILADQDVAHLFDPSPAERTIIEHRGTSYVIGRGGTGKTTAMMFKIFMREKQWVDLGMKRPRQIFVTKSSVLATKVEENFKKFKRALDASTKDPHDIIREQQQLNTLNADASELHQGIANVDDIERLSGKLPKKYGSLTDEDFPLFITYDRLCFLLELELDKVDEQQYLLRVRQESCLVTFSIFKYQYWVHFPQGLTKGFEPVLVFSEILGVIKGSEAALETLQGFLDLSAYCGLSDRRNSHTVAQREAIYRLFQHYEKRRRSLGHIDVADRTRELIKRNPTYEEKCPRTLNCLPKADFVYVDEAQDNLLIDALVLRVLCKRPDGLMWVGDTAQAIAAGSSFRFNELTAFNHRLEESYQRMDGYPHNVQKPKTFQLTTNYRSHAGIVDCAHAIIETISRFWPNSIDILERETGLLAGIKPLFLTGWEDGNFDISELVSAGRDESIEFGAKQCILVRDNKVRESLQSKANGKLGLIMTTYDAKGLEFDDVLLWNFFEDSTAEVSQWRVLLNMIPEYQRPGLAAPAFDEFHHASICTELKNLYVATTRARHRLWIVDASPKSDPFRLLLLGQDLVTEWRPNMELPEMAKKSGKLEWEATGRSMFENQRYFEAMQCFERAGQTREQRQAEAYYLRDEARSTSSSRGAMAGAFVKAAEAFMDCAESNHFYQRLFYKTAGECFSNASEFSKAAKAFRLASDYDNYVTQLGLGRLYDELLGALQKYRTQINGALLPSLIESTCLHFFKCESSVEHKKVDVLLNTEEKLLFVTKHKLDDIRASILMELGRYKESAELYLSKGRYKDAILSYLKDAVLIDEAKNCLFDTLSRTLPLGADTKTNPTASLVTQLLEISQRFPAGTFSKKDRDEIEMFMCLHGSHKSRLVQLAQKFLRQGNDGAALHCFYHSLPPWPANLNSKTWDTIDLSLQYLRTAHGLAQRCKSHAGPIHLRILGLFQDSKSKGEYWVSTNSLLYRHIAKHPKLGHRTPQDHHLRLSIPRADGAISHLFNSLVDKLSIKYEAALSSLLPPLCISQAVLGECMIQKCTFFHLDDHTEKLEDRLRIQLYHICVVQIRKSYEPQDAHQLCLRRQIGHVYDVLVLPFQRNITRTNTLRKYLDTDMVVYVRSWLKDAREASDSKWFRAQYISQFVQVTLMDIFLQGLLEVDHALDYSIGGVSVRKDLLPILVNQPASTVIHSMLSICGVIESIGIDADILFQPIEYVCTQLAISWHTTLPSQPHNVFVSQEWAIRALQRFMPLGPIPLIKPLLNQIASKASSTISFVARAMWTAQAGASGGEDILRSHEHMSRVCRAMYLVAVNHGRRDANLHDSILRDLDILPVLSRRRSDDSTHEISAKLEEIARVRLSQQDDILRICQAQQPFLPLGSTASFKEIVYETWDDLYRQITGHARPINTGDAHMGPPTYRTIAPRTAKSTDERPAGGMQSNTPTSPECGTVLNEHELISAFLREEESTIRILRKWTRFRVIGRIKPDATTSVGHFYKKAAAFVKSRPKISRSYKFILLGPLPHALVCAEVIVGALDERKSELKLEAKQGVIQSRELTQVSKALQQAHYVRRVLRLDSGIHKKENVEGLRVQVRALHHLARQFPQGMTEIRDDLQISLKGLVASPPHTFMCAYRL